MGKKEASSRQASGRSPHAPQTPPFDTWVGAAFLIPLLAAIAAGFVSLNGISAMLGPAGALCALLVVLMNHVAAVEGLGGLRRAAFVTVGLMVVVVPLTGCTQVLDTYDLPKQSVTTVLMALAVILWAAALFLDRHEPDRIRPGLATCVLLLGGASVLSLCQAINVLLGVFEVGRTLLFIGTLLVVHDVASTPAAARRLLTLAAFTAMVVAWIASIQSLGIEIPCFPQVARPAATFGNKNMATEYLVLVFPASLVLTLWADTVALSWGGALVALLMSYVLSVARTRADWIASALAIALVAGAWVVYRLRPFKGGEAEEATQREWLKRRMNAGLAAAALLACSVVGGYLIFPDWSGKALAAAVVAAGAIVLPGRPRHPELPDAVADRVDELDRRERRMAGAIVAGVFLTICLANVARFYDLRSVPTLDGAVESALDTSKGSTQWRVVAWANSLAMVADRWLLGVGANNWQLQYPLYHRKWDVDPAFDTRTQATTLHNDFIQYWAELGILGVVGFVGLFVLAILGLRTCSKRLPHPWAAIGVAASAGILASGVDGFFSFPFRLCAPMMQFFVLLGVLERAVRELSAQPGTAPGPARDEGVEAVAPRRGAAALLAAATLGGVYLSYWAIADLEGSFHMRNAYIVSSQNRWKEAANEFLVAAEWCPYIYNPHLLLGRAYYQCGDFARAVAANQLAARCHPNHCNIYYNMANCYRDLGRLEDALAAFDHSLELLPVNADAWNNRGNILKALRRYPAALESYQKALKQNPELLEALFNGGNLLLETGRVTEGRDYFADAVKKRPKMARARQALGNACLRLGDVSGAIEQYEEATRLDPGYVDALNNLGAAYWQKGDATRGQLAYERAIGLRHTFAPSHFGLADILLRQGKKREALAEYELFLRFWPHRDGNWKIANDRIAQIRAGH